MDIIVLVLLSVCGQVVSVTLRQCPDSSVWSVDLLDCVPCKELCGRGKKDTASSPQNSQQLRRHGHGRHKRDDNDCGDFNYYDPAIHGCTPCDHLCDYHEHQGTTQRCMEKCPDYYARMGPTASSQEERSTKDTSPDDSKGDATLTVALIIFAIVFVLCTCVMVWKRNQIWQFLERQCTTDEEKTSVPCSQEQGICESANYKTPLTHSLGPICQPVTETRHENKADQYLYTETFAEIDLRYAVLDEPLTGHTTIPKQTCCTDYPSQTASIYHTTIPKQTCCTDYPSQTSFTYHSTTPTQTVSSDGTNLTTYPSHSTIPKVVETDSDDTHS